MSRYADPTKEDDTKPTMALDYSYVRKDAKRESAQVMLPAGFFFALSSSLSPGSWQN